MTNDRYGHLKFKQEAITLAVFFVFHQWRVCPYFVASGYAGVG